MFSRTVLTLLPVALATAVAATVKAQELSDEQRAEIEARIAPVGSVCLQGENCGGLPKASTPMAAAPKPKPKPAASASAPASVAADESGPSSAGMASSDENAPNASDAGGSDAASDGASGEAVADTAEAAPAAAETVASADPAIDGEAIYNQACMACHMSGVGGAPVVGNIDSWAPRIAKGIEALHASGLNGVAGTAMMAKGGRMDLSDAQVMAAVDYMVSSSQ